MRKNEKQEESITKGETRGANQCCSFKRETRSAIFFLLLLLSSHNGEHILLCSKDGEYFLLMSLLCLKYTVDLSVGFGDEQNRPKTKKRTIFYSIRKSNLDKQWMKVSQSLIVFHHSLCIQT